MESSWKVRSGGRLGSCQHVGSTEAVGRAEEVREEGKERMDIQML